MRSSVGSKHALALIMTERSLGHATSCRHAGVSDCILGTPLWERLRHSGRRGEEDAPTARIFPKSVRDNVPICTLGWLVGQVPWGRCLLCMAILALLSTSPPPALRAQSRFTCAQWMLLEGTQKFELAESLIRYARDSGGVTVRIPATHYVQALDALIGEYARNRNQPAMTSSLGLAWHTVAAMDGDWGNGEDPLVHAQEWLGTELFGIFKDRDHVRYEHLVELHAKWEARVDSKARVTRPPDQAPRACLLRGAAPGSPSSAPCQRRFRGARTG